MHHSFAFSEQLTPFSHIFFVHFTFSIIQQCVCEFLLHEHFLVFKNSMTDSTSQVVGFSVVTFSDYSDWGEMMTSYYAIHITPVLTC